MHPTKTGRLKRDITKLTLTIRTQLSSQRLACVLVQSSAQGTMHAFPQSVLAKSTEWMTMTVQHKGNNDKGKKNHMRIAPPIPFEKPAKKTVE